MFSFISNAIDRSRAVIAIMLALIVAGMMSYISIPREADPDIPIPYIYVGVSLPGISPTDAERLLIKPLELELRRLTGVEEVISTANQNYAAVILKFDVSFDKDQALIDVREKVNMAKAELPDDAEEPVIREFNASLFPVIMVNLSGEAPEREVYQRARALKDVLAALPNVLEANLVGHREELLEITIDPRKLEIYGITTTQLYRAIGQNNQLVPAGSMQSAQGSFSVSVPGLIERPEDIANISLKTNGDAVVKLSDVAEIRRGFKDATSYARFNGKPTIGIEVTKRLGSNIIETTQMVRDVTKDFTANWPSSISVDYSSDFSSIIFDMIGGLEVSITNAIALVMILVIAALGLRSALLVGFAIPASFLIGFFIISLMGHTLNMMIMFGLILSVGILVDGAIVIVEYADRKMAEGLHRKQAYAMAAARMFWPITSSTATTLAAFAPILFWPGVSGKFMSYLPITVIIVLTGSLLTAMVFLPVLGGLFGKSEQDGDDVLSGLAAESNLNILEMPGFTGRYVRFIDWCIRRPVRVLAAGVITLISIVFFYGQSGKGVEFFIEIEPHQANVYVRARGNISANEASALIRRVEAIVLQTPGISAAFSQSISTSENGGGGDRNQPRDTIGKILIEFTHYTTRPPATQIIRELEMKSRSIPGIIVEVSEREDGPPTGKDLEIEVAGHDFGSLDRAASMVRDYMESRTNQLQDIEDSRNLPGIEWNLLVDREAAGRFGVDIAALGGIVQFVTNGVLVGHYRPDDADDEIDIRARFPAESRSLDALDQLRIGTANGFVPITNFVSRQPEQRIGQISRKDGLRIVNIKANTQVNPETGSKILATTAVSDFQEWLNQQTLPAGSKVSILGANKEQQDAAAFLGRAMLASLFLMFIILLLQFNSIYLTMMTLSTVILSTIGVLLGMALTGQRFSVVMTGTGIVALAGIVVNNSIVLIDTYQRLVRNMSPYAAVLRAAGQRLRPILLTTITTMIGLLPMAMHASVNVLTREIEYGSPGGSWWVQFATAIVFGLGFSTLLTLIMVPVLIALPSRKKTLAEEANRFTSSALKPGE